MTRSRGIVLAIVLIVLVLRSLDSTEEAREEEPFAPRPEAHREINLAAPWPIGDAPDLAPQPVTSNYYVVLDGSGSMERAGCSSGRAKFEVAREALEAFVKTLPPNANVGLSAFDREGVAERLPLAPADPAAFVREIRQIAPDGPTPLRTAIEEAYAALEAQGKRQLGYGEYHLVVVTDGEANQNEVPTSVVNEILRSSPVVIHTIGFCIGQDHSLNQPGRTLYRAANNPEELRAALGQVLAEAPSFPVGQFQDDL